MADPRWRALSIGEINPARSVGDPHVLTRFATTLADVLTYADRSSTGKGNG
jgi:arginase